MPASKRRNGSRLALFALAATAIFLLPASEAGAVTYNNACVNNVIPTQSSLIPVTMTATTEPAAPVEVEEGDSITLKEIEQDLEVPPAVFIAGYNAEILTTGLNKIPIELKTLIRGTNTLEESLPTNTAETEAETTITDPDGTPGTGDETATPGVVEVTYNNQIWTADASGPINFREKTQAPLSALEGGIQIVAKVGPGGILKTKFGCDPGTVEESAPPETITLNTAPAFASLVNKDPSNRAPTANAGPDQQVGTGTNVKLNGFASSDSSEETFALEFKWTQTGGPAVTLSGATTPEPTFTAPSEPSTLTFQLEVCDNDAAPLCSSPDEVVISAVNLAPTANAGPDQAVASGAGVTLDGSGSSDPNGDPLTYEWTQTGGPSVALGGANTANTTFTAPTGPATLGFELEVCDNGSPELCDTDSVVITVNTPTPSPSPKAKNKPPNTKLKSIKIKKRSVTFKFTSNEKGSIFLCKLDKKKFAKCKSPKTYKHLKPGKHRFKVKARDKQGKVDPSPVVKKFRIKRKHKRSKH